MARKRAGDPELSLVSFCDIVTVSCVALFMAMVVIIDQSMRTPIIRPTPMTEATTNLPVYFECRAEQLFPIDRAALMQNIRTSRETMKKASKPGGAEAEALAYMMNQDIGDEVYRVDNSFLTIGILALRPRIGSHGLSLESLPTPTGAFQKALKQYDHQSHYLVFYVRDDSFALFRKARDLAHAAGFPLGWEYLERDEPITFAGMMGNVGTQ